MTQQHTASTPQFAHRTHPPDPRQLRVGGVLMAGGAVVMFAGALVHFSTGADLWGDTAKFLRDADGQQSRFAWNLSLWILGALTMTMGIFVAADGMGRRPGAASVILLAVARYAAAVGGGAVLVFFPMMLGLVQGLAGTEGLEPAAESIQVTATLADDLTTLLILVGGGVGLVVGAGPSLFGRVVRGLAALSSVIGVYYLLEVVGVVPVGPGFALVPAGLLLMAAAGLRLVRQD